MDKAQLDALLAAHGGRAQPVAQLHVLRGATLGAVDHAFLVENAASLATLDLSRWLERAAPEQRPAVLEALVTFAEREPARFEHEIARAPHFGLRDGERTELITRLVGRAPESVIAALSRDNPGVSGVLHPAEVALGPGDGESAGFFDPGELLGDVDFGSDFLGGGGADSASDGLPAGGIEVLDEPGESALGSPATPVLDALLEGLAAAKTPRARAAWKKRSLDAARDGAEDWGPRVTVLTPPMRDAVAARASASRRGEERAALLEWLLQNGGRRSLLVGLTLGLLSLGEAAGGAREWLAQSWIPRLLPDRASWSRHGIAVLDALVENNAYSELDGLFTATASGGAAMGPGLSGAGEPPPADLRAALFSAMSGMLAARVERALKAGHRKEALAASAALSCLGVPRRARPRLTALRKKQAAQGDVATLLALAGLRARGPEEPPHLEDLIATVHVLSDAMT